MRPLSDELLSLRKLSRPFGHARLAAFFVAVGLLSALAGSLATGLSPGDARWPAIVAAAVAAALGFGGVVLHRMRTNPIRWRETAQYLARIQRESERYRALLEGAADMLLVVDPQSGRVQECNALARKSLGLSVSEGRLLRAGSRATEEPGASPAVDIAELVLPSGRAALTELLSFAERGEAAGRVAELPLRSPSGETVLADARAAAISLGGELSVLLSLRDVTRQKALERELQIRERLSSIGLMTAGVAHDINNPLEGIGNYLVLLSRPGVPEADRARYLERVEEGFARIRGLARELLRFARPDGDRATVDLADVVHRARRLASFAPHVEDSVIEVEGLDQPLYVLGDAGRLEQVVFNLLTNAAAALRGKEQGRIRVTARAFRGEGGAEEIEVAVADDGPGIAAEDLDRIFDPFFSRTGGWGLGLSVCYATMLAHGGTLAAHNREQGGAELVFRLPAAESARRASA